MDRTHLIFTGYTRGPPKTRLLSAGPIPVKMIVWLERARSTKERKDARYILKHPNCEKQQPPTCTLFQYGHLQNLAVEKHRFDFIKS
ncbi:MAG: hypothetical protein D8M57_00375 [Candidatus Scalindua sp. AMX11]|nr:MAG: hypothetical protein DWQ00_18610 [Candidatus Scalindua sp.]TDE66877.1 MAG: hypothetical protein D8M57_00375 [Candidatus Scalindua sp. AMX11]